jgi:hypothetical protein
MIANLTHAFKVEPASLCANRRRRISKLLPSDLIHNPPEGSLQFRMRIGPGPNVSRKHYLTLIGCFRGKSLDEPPTMNV